MKTADRKCKICDCEHVMFMTCDHENFYCDSCCNPPQKQKSGGWESRYNDRFAFLDKIIESYAIPNSKSVNWGKEIRSFISTELQEAERRVINEVLSDIPEITSGTIGEESHKESYRLGQIEYEHKIRIILLNKLNKLLKK